MRVRRFTLFHPRKAFFFILRFILKEKESFISIRRNGKSTFSDWIGLTQGGRFKTQFEVLLIKARQACAAAAVISKDL